MRVRRPAALLSLLAACVTQAPFEAPGSRPVDGESSHEVEAADGLRISYAEAGPVQAGGGANAIVFLHGWCEDRSYWAGQVESFSESARVLAIDLAGHGDSGTARSDWSIPGLAADVVRVLEAADVQHAVLVGHSMGAPVALEVARNAPERVSGVVGVDALHDVKRRMPRQSFEAVLQEYERDFVSTCRRAAASLFLPDADPDLVAWVVEDMSASPPDVAIGLFRTFQTYDAADALGAADVPVRCINSARLSTNVQGNREVHADFDVVIVHGVGHLPMLERPTTFDRLLEETIVSLGSE